MAKESQVGDLRGQQGDSASVFTGQIMSVEDKTDPSSIFNRLGFYKDNWVQSGDQTLGQIEEFWRNSKGEVLMLVRPDQGPFLKFSVADIKSKKITKASRKI